MLRFEIREGRSQHCFLREGPVAAHVQVTSGARARLVVAFAAENEGMRLTFAARSRPEIDLSSSKIAAASAGAAHGVSFLLDASGSELRAGVLLASCRALRLAEAGAVVPSDAERSALGSIRPLELCRELHGGRRLILRVEPLGGATASAFERDGRLELALERPSGGGVRVRITALTEARPLTPIAREELLERPPASAAGERDLDALAFLSFEEKLLAGSWRFLSYFGRDTLLCARLLLPVLRPRVVEAALSSVIERLGPSGEVAHEESFGDWASLTSPTADPRPSYDYKMVDDDFLLAPVAAAYLLDSADGPARAASFLSRESSAGASYGSRLRQNLELVIDLARPFAERPSVERLIALRPGERVGDWRDSDDGLGGGRFSYGVNAALVPAALAAAARLLSRAPLRDEALARRAESQEQVWSERASGLFQVEVDASEACRRVRDYAAEVGVDPAAALDAIAGPIGFSALALDAEGRPLPVICSDGGFALLFGDPEPALLEQIAGQLLRPFPAGLRTPVGIVVANPALCADPELRARFTRDHYHGTVVWSWQHALLAAGLRRQLQRPALPRSTRQLLRSAEVELWRLIDATSEQRRSELWSWRADGARYELVPYGASDDHQGASNPVQLWSSVFLAVGRPG